MIIAFHGRAGAGKDTAADYLCQTRSLEKLAFADPLKEGCRHLFALSDKQLYDPKEKEINDVRWNKSPRQLMQWLGTDVLRSQLTNDFFIRHMRTRIYSIIGNKDKSWSAEDSGGVVICDVRFQDEADLVKTLGGTIIKIIRPGHKGTTTHHSSEGDGIQCDHTIINDSTPDKIYKALEEFMSQE
tara:strand:- start:1009 stop:1563 length:555 start_codon:yes stop_codon:yes gene_type:complete